MKSTRGFTLIELLVVIAIIGILMALLFPAVSGALDAAKKAQAKNDVTQIATAVVAYETEYGRLPGSGSSDSSTKVTGDVLTALTTNHPTLNPRGIIFIETQTWKKGKGGIKGNAWKDPWDNDYMVALDMNYDNRVTAGTNSTSVVKKVAVWNVPTTGKDSENKRRYVTSWE